ncbi:hypothetical protein OHS58_46275 [Amycolatopsis sp. NBC_00348]|uniref:hypothetical protein n=1 Tax=Amycolatopsis sp. NBC_00348 TaxID=2975956 RepID=UPI002E27515F
MKAASARVQTARWVAGVAAVVAVALAVVALLPQDPWRTSLLTWAVIAGLGAVTALVD